MFDPVTVGGVTIQPVQETALSGSRSFMFPAIAEDRWEPWRRYCNPRGNLIMNVGSFLVRSAGQTLLIDTGLGDKGRPNYPQGHLLANLAEVGVQPRDIDQVVITHLHVDHVGWNTLRQGDGWAPTFPNARYRIVRAEWDYFTAPERAATLDYMQDSVLPLTDSGQLDLVEGEHRLTPELSLVPSPGHTPAHACVAVASGGEHAMIIGDLAHHPVQLTELEWSVSFDLDPKLAAATRAALVERMEREQALVIGGHFPPPGIGRLLRLDGQRLWQPL